MGALPANKDFKQNILSVKGVGGVLNKCGSFCSNVLEKLGVRLEDKSSRLEWKVVDPKELKKEMEQKELETTKGERGSQRKEGAKG